MTSRSDVPRPATAVSTWAHGSYSVSVIVVHHGRRFWVRFIGADVVGVDLLYDRRLKRGGIGQVRMAVLPGQTLYRDVVEAARAAREEAGRA